MSALPLIDGYRAEDPLGASAGRTLSAREFLARARDVAATLPEARCALLLCQDRVGFGVGLAALLLRRTTALLPSSHAPHALAALADANAPGFALVDAPGAAPATSGVPEIAIDASSATGERGTDFQVPGIDPDHVALVVHTSGTTGVPQPHPKRWSSLVRGARGLRERIRFAPGDALVGTVPPQHMWGLEASVMLPLQAGGIVHAGTPLLPEEIAGALGELAAPRWLVLTPLHLRALLATRKAVPALRCALSATMPLERADAEAFEAATAAPLIEIYGSTETGVAATRRTAREAPFTPLAGIVVRDGGRGLALQGGQLDEIVTLGDRGAVGADGTFTLQGRDADLVKVGGKRASLVMLERTLAAVPGVLDAAFVVTGADRPTPRLAAVVVAPGVEREWLLAELRQRIDPVFLPRPLRFVDALPRNALGKIPAEVLQRLVASPQVAAAAPARSTSLQVPPTHPSLPGHFPGRPIVPAALLLTLVAADCAARLGVSVVGVPRARFRSPMLPGAAVSLELERRGPGEVAFHCSSEGRRIADGVLAVQADGMRA